MNDPALSAPLRRAPLRRAPPRRVPPRLQLLGIAKYYPSVVANADIDLTVMPGEIHAVLGENGAGKSTLMKIIYGVTRPDAGEILWEGRQVTIRSPSDARKLGIGMVFQHFALCETLTVAENMALVLDEKITPDQLAPRIRAVSEQYGLPLDPHRRVHSMSVGERQRGQLVRRELAEIHRRARDRARPQGHGAGAGAVAGGSGRPDRAVAAIGVARLRLRCHHRRLCRAPASDGRAAGLVAAVLPAGRRPVHPLSLQAAPKTAPPEPAPAPAQTP